jgi:hypothetical protein
VEPALDVETRGDRCLQEVAPGGRKPAALRRHADDRNRRLVPECVIDRRDDGDPVVIGAGSLRVDDRNHRIGPVADDPAHRLPVVRVV